MNSTGKKSRVRWDEDNLKENEKVKKELNPQTIEEPKTPYHCPMEEVDVEEYQRQFVTELSKEGLDIEMEEADKSPTSKARVSFDTPLGPEEGLLPESGAHQKFAEQRKEHYRMKGVLNKGSALLKEDKT